MEEGEEGMLTEGEVSSVQDDSDLNDKPPAMKLLDRYDKYVEYIEMLIEKPGHYFEYLAPFDDPIRYAVKHILSSKSKEEISLVAFPVRIRIFLVPELNVLTVQVVSDNVSTDQILSDLIGSEDQGSQLML